MGTPKNLKGTSNFGKLPYINYFQMVLGGQPSEAAAEVGPSPSEVYCTTSCRDAQTVSGLGTWDSGWFKKGKLILIRWILKILHDPKYLTSWELWYYSILGACRIFSINSISNINTRNTIIVVIRSDNNGNIIVRITIFIVARIMTLIALGFGYEGCAHSFLWRPTTAHASCFSNPLSATLCGFCGDHNGRFHE